MRSIKCKLRNLRYLTRLNNPILLQESVESVSPDISLSDISSRMEQVVQTMMEKLRDHDLNEIKSSLMEEQVWNNEEHYLIIILWKFYAMYLP